MAENSKSLRCSFCGKPESQVQRMIQGPGVRICDECVQLCMSLLDDGYDAEPEAPASLDQIPTPHEIKAVLDFVNAGEVPIGWELIRSYSYMDCTFNAARLAAYTNEYRRYAEVSMDDLRYMPYLYLGQLLSSTYGYKQYLQTGDEELLAFGRWRTEMCRYLIANAGEVSAELVRLA